MISCQVSQVPLLSEFIGDKMLKAAATFVIMEATPRQVGCGPIS